MVAVTINYLAVLAASIVHMILGFLWYGPVFGKQWMALSGVNPNKEGISKGKMNQLYLMAFIGALIMNYVLAHAFVFASNYMEVSGAAAGLSVGFWNWLGFIAPVTLGSVLWEGKSWKLWGLNNSYQLLSLLIAGVIIALWQ